MVPSEEDYEELKTYECLMDANTTDKDLVALTNPDIADSSLEEIVMYPWSDFDITPQ